MVFCLGATVTRTIRGTFIGSHSGLGTGLTNASGIPYAVTNGSVASATRATYATLATNAITATNWTGVTASNNYNGTFTGSGAGLTGIADTNFNANLYAASTNASINNSLAVTGLTGDGYRLAVRGTSAQTNDVLQVQTALNALVFGVQLNGTLRWGDAPTNATMGSNVVLYLVVTNNGVGYALPLHALTD